MKAIGQHSVDGWVNANTPARDEREPSSQVGRVVHVRGGGGAFTFARDATVFAQFSRAPSPILAMRSNGITAARWVSLKGDGVWGTSYTGGHCT